MSEHRSERDDQVGPTPPKGPSTRTVVALVVVVLVAVFIVVNWQTTRISFVFFHAEAPLWVALAVAAGGGFLGGFLVSRKRYRG